MFLQSASTASGQILQNLKFISSDALKDLQNENIIIVSDENNREIGKIINDNGFLLVGNERGKENVQIVLKSDKPLPSEVKVEVKEEAAENNVSDPDYDEIERKLKEICDENETDSSNTNNNSPIKINNQIIETESIYSLDLESDSESRKENSNQETDSNSIIVRRRMKRKRKIRNESLNEENATKTSQSLNKTEDETQFTEDVTDIINDLETESSVDCSTQQSKYVTATVPVKNSLTNGTSKPIIKDDIQLKFDNKIVNRSTQKMNNVTNTSNIKSSNKLLDKLNVQGEVIEKLTNQLIMYKDMDRKMRRLTQELENKNKEILIQKVSFKKLQIERETSRCDNFDLKNASETELKNRIEFLEGNNKKLMKTVTLETQNRKKLELQVKSRDNQIKELNWKLEKASKFLDRAEKNTNNYRKKMLNMQALIRRKKLLNKKSSTFDELLVCQSDKKFTDNALKIALEIEKTCSIEGYQKLLDYEFPLPNLKELSKKYPEEVEYYEAEEEEVILGSRESDNANETSHNNNNNNNNNIKMENVEYLDPEFLEEPDETVTGTVQDIFNECSDDEDLNLNELRKHIMIDMDDST